MREVSQTLSGSFDIMQVFRKGFKVVLSFGQQIAALLHLKYRGKEQILEADEQ